MRAAADGELVILPDHARGRRHHHVRLHQCAGAEEHGVREKMNLTIIIIYYYMYVGFYVHVIPKSGDFIGL